jgi:hypothetical protein
MDEERLVIRQNLKEAMRNQVVSVEQILRAQAVREVYMDEKIEKYILDIILPLPREI